MLQQFDNNVDKAVQAFMDGKYSVPFSLRHERFSCMLKCSLALVAQNIFCCSAEIQMIVTLRKLGVFVCFCFLFFFNN